jgi:kynureninase
MASASNDVNFKHMFRIPTKGDLRRKTISKSENGSKRDDDDDEPSIYLCGNSLGLQPTLTQK